MSKGNFNYHQKMNIQKESPNNDVGALAEDVRALMLVTAGMAGEKISEARKRLAAALERGKEIVGDVRDKAAHGAKMVDRNVHENPYQAIAMGMGLGVLMGYFAVRRGFHHSN